MLIVGTESREYRAATTTAVNPSNAINTSNARVDAGGTLHSGIAVYCQYTRRDGVQTGTNPYY